jgi:hypothetical protein
MVKSRGYTNIPNEEFERTDIKGNNKLVYLCLLRFRNNKTGKANPSQQRLADMTGLAVKTINRCTKNLIDKNIVNVLKSKGINNEYSFNYQRQNVATTSVTESLASNCPMGSVKMSPELASKCPPKTTIKNTSTIKKEIIKKKKIAKSNGLPDWLDKEGWLWWTSERKDMKKPLTDKAIEIQFKLLKKYTKAEQRKIIERSISCRYQGLFPLKEQGTRNNRGASNKNQTHHNVPTEGKYVKYVDNT